MLRAATRDRGNEIRRFCHADEAIRSPIGLARPVVRIGEHRLAADLAEDLVDGRRIGIDPPVSAAVAEVPDGHHAFPVQSRTRTCPIIARAATILYRPLPVSEVAMPSVTCPACGGDELDRDEAASSGDVIGV